MDDELPPDDPLRAVVGALHQGVRVRDGLPHRIAHRERRQGWVRRGVTVVAIAIVLLVLAPRLDGTQQVTFALQLPNSRHVALVGDFTDWRTDKLALSPTRAGGWQVTLRLRPGRYRFAYVADNGEWLADATAAPVLDDFGRSTSVLTVVAQ